MGAKEFVLGQGFNGPGECEEPRTGSGYTNGNGKASGTCKREAVLTAELFMPIEKQRKAHCTALAGS